MKEQRSNLKVNGIDYEWWVSRQPQWCHEDGWQAKKILADIYSEIDQEILPREEIKFLDCFLVGLFAAFGFLSK